MTFETDSKAKQIPKELPNSCKRFHRRGPWSQRRALHPGLTEGLRQACAGMRCSCNESPYGMLTATELNGGVKG